MTDWFTLRPKDQEYCPIGSHWADPSEFINRRGRHTVNCRACLNKLAKQKQRSRENKREFERAARKVK